MSAVSYEQLSSTVAALDAMRHKARALDAVEAQLSFAAAAAAMLPAVAFAQMASRAAAAQWWASTEASMARLRSCQAWIIQSRQSVGALGAGASSWDAARDRAVQARDTMKSVFTQTREWDGAGADSQREQAQQQITAQSELVGITTRLGAGCRTAQEVMSRVFLDIQAGLESQRLRCAGTAQRMPSVTTNLFALNSRIKIVAAALSAAADDFEAVRGGRGWAPEAAQLTQRFSIDGAALTEIMDATRSKMAMRAV